VSCAFAASIAHALWTKHDATAISEIFTEDIVFEDVPFGMTFHGYDGVTRWLERVLAGIPDFAEEITDVLDGCPDVIVKHCTFSATFRDYKTFPDRNVEKAFSLPGLSVITMRVIVARWIFDRMKVRSMATLTVLGGVRRGRCRRRGAG
jgi:hypothetical protein